MVRFFKSLRAHWLLAGIVCSGLVVSTGRCFSAFDDPFPQTQFKKVWKIATQVFHMFTVLVKSSPQDYDRELLVDACLGKLVHLEDSVRELQRSDQEVESNDIESLKKLLKQVKEKVSKIKEPADVSRLMELFAKKIVALGAKL